jgi:5-methyltetrahydropteroyltriglutamate--homocysteine methyltransferase
MAMKTTVVGSYPVPGWLLAQPTEPNLRDALLVVLRTQELAGIDVLSDGELTRFDPGHPETNGMIETFVTPLEGVARDLDPAELDLARAGEGMSFRTRPGGVVRGPVARGRLDFRSERERLVGLCERPVKFTLTSPYMLAKTLLDRHYGDLPALTEAIADALAIAVAEVDAPVIQVDEANLTGHPEDAAWAAGPVNRVLDAVQGTERGLHLCFGNYGGSTIQEGHYRALVAFLNELHVDHLVLELARREPAELEALADLRPDLGVGVGVIDIKDNEVETPECVARRIERACEVLGAERVRWVHPDCGFWMLPRPVADKKMHALVAGRDLFAG